MNRVIARDRVIAVIGTHAATSLPLLLSDYSTAGSPDFFELAHLGMTESSGPGTKIDSKFRLEENGGYAPMARTVRILSVSYDCALMSSRSMLLRHTGFQVEDVHSRSQALKSARSDRFDVLLICHTLPEADRKHLIAAVRERRPDMPILCITESDYFPANLENCRVVLSAPEELLAAVNSALKASW